MKILVCLNLQQIAPGWSEYDRFLLGPGLFSGAMLVLGSVYINIYIYINISHIYLSCLFQSNGSSNNPFQKEFRMIVNPQH